MPTRIASSDFAPPTAMPLHKVLRMRQEQLHDLTNAEIARRLGYPKSNVIAMMMTGSMNVPIAKVRELADALELEPLWLLQRVAGEYIPEAWSVIEQVVGEKRLVSQAELALVRQIRDGLMGEPIDLTEDERFSAGLQDLLASALERHLKTLLAVRSGEDAPARSRNAKEQQEMLKLLRRQADERRALRKQWRERAT